MSGSGAGGGVPGSGIGDGTIGSRTGSGSGIVGVCVGSGSGMIGFGDDEMRVLMGDQYPQPDGFIPD